MAKYYVPKEVLDSMKGVASDKNEFEYLDSVGATTERDAYNKAAKSKYDVINAYSPELAATIKNSNAQQTRDLIKEYGEIRDSSDILKDISPLKYGYEFTKANGGNYKPYEEQAFSLYQELEAVDPSLGAMVKNMNYSQLNDYLNGKNPEIPVAPQRSKYDIARDILGFKQGYEGGMKHGVANFVDNHYQAQAYYDELKKIDPAMAAAIEGMNASELANYLEANTPKEPMNAEGMYNASYNAVSSSGKQFQNNLDTMYFDETYGQGVRDNFNLYGGAKANQAAANAAAANGGNFDSFADYNKNLTDMSYRIAGENAIQRMREGYANDYTNFLNVWGNQLMGNAKNFGDYEYDNRQLESNERIAKAQNDKDIYAIDKGYGAEVYGYDTQKDIAKAQNETDITITGMNNETQLAITGISKDTELAIAKIQSETEKYGYDSAERVAAIEDATSRYIADLDAKLRQGEIDLNRYIADLQHAAQLYGLDTEKYIAQVQAEAEKYGYDKQAYVASMDRGTTPKYTSSYSTTKKTGTTSTDTEIKPTGVSDTEVNQVEGDDKVSNITDGATKAITNLAWEIWNKYKTVGTMNDGEYKDSIIAAAKGLEEKGYSDKVVEEFLNLFGMSVSDISE